MSLGDALKAAATDALKKASTMFGLGPIGSVIVFGLVVLIVTLVWVLRKSPSGSGGGASAPPRDVPVWFAESAPAR
jgi:hypothetical protein